MLMLEMPHRTRGFQITKCYPSVAHTNFQASCCSLSHLCSVPATGCRRGHSWQKQHL